MWELLARNEHEGHLVTLEALPMPERRCRVILRPAAGSGAAAVLRYHESAAEGLHDYMRVLDSIGLGIEQLAARLAERSAG